MHLLSKAILVLSILGVAALPAAANVIYNNGVPDLQDGYGSDFDPDLGGGDVFYESADDFVLGGVVTVQDIHWWGVYGFSNSPGTDDFTIRIFADNAGEPAVAPLLEISGVTGNRVATGDIVIGALDLYEYSVDITPTILAGGTTYWISIVNNTADDSDDYWFWATSADSGNALQRPDGGAWDSVSHELAFQLTGARGIVPEPASMALLGLGLAGLVVRHRKK